MHQHPKVVGNGHIKHVLNLAFFNHQMILNNHLETIFPLRKKVWEAQKWILFFLVFRFFVQQCEDIYGPKYNDNLLERGINFTNAFYGAEGFSGTRVLFVNGAIDPWHALSFTKDPPNNNTAIFLSSMLKDLQR
jgi:hypothetical protein